jgi:hypothetical protein
MDEIVIPGRDSGRRAFQQVLALDGPPAFARRAHHVQEAYDALLHRCRVQREEWLALVRSRLGTLWALAGDGPALRPLLEDGEQIEVLRRLHAALEPKPRLSVLPTTSGRVLRRALVELCESLHRFNARWQVYLQQVDLRQINALREGYNKYYVLEKECLLRSARLARQGFQPLPPLTRDDLLVSLPCLDVPILCG